MAKGQATGYMRWTPDEYLTVAVNALPAIAANKPRLEILTSGMRAGLPRVRWRKIADLKRLCAPSFFKPFEKYVEKAQAMSEQERARHIHEPPADTGGHDEPPDPPKLPPKVTDEGRSPIDGLIHRNHRNQDIGREYTGGFRWTDHEKARLARMVRYWIDNKIDDRSLGRLFAEAQELVLPRERRRSIHGLIQGNIGGSSGFNGRAYADGLNSLYLIAGEKFHPEGEFGPMAEARKAREAREVQEQRERSMAGMPAAPPPTPEAPSPTSPSGMMFDIPSEGQTAPELGPHTSMIGEASKAFGASVMAALEKLLAVHTRVLMDEVQARLQGTAQLTGAAIAAHIERGLRGTVRTIMNEELGNPPPPPEPERKRLKVDVVGFEHGAHETTISQAFNGDVDLRFVHPDKASAYAPHKGRHVIVLLQRIPHSLGNKIKAANVEPIYVRRTTGHVIHAIEELMRSEGIEQAAHA